MANPKKQDQFWKSHVWSTVPGLAWIVWDASYVANDPVGPNHLSVKDSWMLACYFTSTKIRTRHMKTWVTVEPGDLVLIPPQVGFHEYFRQPNGTPADRTWVSFTGENTTHLRWLTHNKNDMALIHDASEMIGTRKYLSRSDSDDDTFCTKLFK